MARTREDLLRRLEDLNLHALIGGGAERIAKQHAAGRLTARERIDGLLDPGSFIELDRLVAPRKGEYGTDQEQVPGDGVVAGDGTVDGRTVFVFAHDFTVHNGSLSAAGAAKICKVIDHAVRVGAPVVGLHDSIGPRIAEGIESLAGYGDVFVRTTLASGAIPQLSAVLGPCVGTAVFAPAVTDFVFMVDATSYMFVTGPDVIKAVTQESVSTEELGGASTHASRSGVSHFTCADDRACLAQLRELLGFLPSNHTESPPRQVNGDPADRESPALDTLVPLESSRSYDIRDVLAVVVDQGNLVEVQANFAMNIVCALARIDGRPVGIVANQPAVLAGCLDVSATAKAARFVRFCDGFNIPIVTFVDVPGFLPGTDQEYGGLIKHGAALIFAYAEATVPKITVITRKAYGGAYAIMASQHLRADLNLAWPTAEIAVMSAEGAVNILHGGDIERAADPAGRRAQLIDDYQSRFANPFRAAELGFVDEVIHPRVTRRRVARALDLLRDKRETLPRKKHGNLPL